MSLVKENHEMKEDKMKKAVGLSHVCFTQAAKWGLLHRVALKSPFTN